MRDETKYRYLSNNTDWRRELSFAFGGGFLLATLLWVGLWYFQARPTQADAIEEKQSVAQELEQRLAQCNEESTQAVEANQRLEAELAQLDRQLKQAWAASSRRPR